MEMRGIEPRASRMQSERSTTELHPLDAKLLQSCDGRVVKALDLKSNGNFPRRFESCSQRPFPLIFLLKKANCNFPTLGHVFTN